MTTELITFNYLSFYSSTTELSFWPCQRNLIKTIFKMKLILHWSQKLQNNSCSKMWFKDQMYIKLGSLPRNHNRDLSCKEQRYYKMLVLSCACCLLFACCLGIRLSKVKLQKNLANSKLHNQTNFKTKTYTYVVPTFYNVVLLYGPILPRGSKVFHIVHKIMDYERMKV